MEKAAAGTFTGIGLELGGKDPGYVMEDANLDAAVETLIDGAMFNSGQCCCWIERIYVVESLFDDFVKKAVEIVNGYKLGNPLDEATTLGPMAHVRFAKEVRNQTAEACEPVDAHHTLFGRPDPCFGCLTIGNQPAAERGKHDRGDEEDGEARQIVRGKKGRRTRIGDQQIPGRIGRLHKIEPGVFGDRLAKRQASKNIVLRPVLMFRPCRHVGKKPRRAFGKRRRLMVAARPGNNISVKIKTGKSGSMTVNHLI